MKTGDSVRDKNGREYEIGPRLGQGLWGKCYAVRESTSAGLGAEYVLKMPLDADDLVGKDRLVRACREILTEQATLLASHRQGLVGLVRAIELPSGAPAMLLEKSEHTLDRLIEQGTSFEELLSVAIGVLRALDRIGLPYHGSLKPGNVLIDDGEVLLSDPVTPALRRNFGALLKASRQQLATIPPETRLAAGEPPFGVITDTYAVAMMLYAALSQDRELPLSGLDKARIVGLKETLVTRLKGEPSNARFHARLADRTGALLGRALSRELSPSPPYRFANVDEMHGRIAEIWHLIQPRVTHVGKLILDRAPGETAFKTDEEVIVTATVGCSEGLDDYNEIATGVAVFDAATRKRVRDVACSYTVDRHPSGRFRFKFRLAQLEPGQYQARIAFAIQQSATDPTTSEIDFGVVAATGYTPDRSAPEPRAIPLHRQPVTAVTSLNTGMNDEKTLPVPSPVDDEMEQPVALATSAVQIRGDEIEEQAIDDLLRVAMAGAQVSASVTARSAPPSIPIPSVVAPPSTPPPLKVPKPTMARVEVRGELDPRPTQPSIPPGPPKGGHSGHGGHGGHSGHSGQRDMVDVRDLAWPELGTGPLSPRSDDMNDLFLADKTDVGSSLEDPYVPGTNPAIRLWESVSGDSYRMFIAGLLMMITVLLGILILMD